MAVFGFCDCAINAQFVTDEHATGGQPGGSTGNA
jgi:hypothetical protein